MHLKGATMDESANGALAAAATYLDLDARELRRQLRGGQSLRALVTERGKSMEGLERALLVDLRAHLQDAVAAGRLSLSGESQLLAAAPRRIEQLVATR
jgi:hypothetical protein